MFLGILLSQPCQRLLLDQKNRKKTTHKGKSPKILYMRPKGSSPYMIKKIDFITHKHTSV